jgi:hypothetical protein
MVLPNVVLACGDLPVRRGRRSVIEAHNIRQGIGHFTYHYRGHHRFESGASPTPPVAPTVSSGSFTRSDRRTSSVPERRSVTPEGYLHVPRGRGEGVDLVRGQVEGQRLGVRGGLPAVLRSGDGEDGVVLDQPA